MMRFRTQNLESARNPRTDDAFREFQVAIFRVALEDYQGAIRDVKRYKQKMRDRRNLTEAEYTDVFAKLGTISEVERFADSEWGRLISPFSDPQHNMFQEGLQWTKVKMRGANLMAEESWQSRLRQRHRERGISQRRVARAVKLTPTEYGRVLAEKRHDIKYAQLMTICQMLDISPVYVVFGTNKSTYYEWLRKGGNNDDEV